MSFLTPFSVLSRRYLFLFSFEISRLKIDLEKQQERNFTFFHRKKSFSFIGTIMLLSSSWSGLGFNTGWFTLGDIICEMKEMIKMPADTVFSNSNLASECSPTHSFTSSCTTTTVFNLWEKMCGLRSASDFSCMQRVLKLENPPPFFLFIEIHHHRPDRPIFSVFPLDYPLFILSSDRGMHRLQRLSLLSLLQCFFPPPFHPVLPSYLQEEAKIWKERLAILPQLAVQFP